MIKVRLILSSELTKEDTAIRARIAESGKVLSIVEVGDAASIVISDDTESLKEARRSATRILLVPEADKKPVTEDIENLQVLDIKGLLQALTRLAK